MWNFLGGKEINFYWDDKNWLNGINDICPESKQEEDFLSQKQEKKPCQSKGGVWAEHRAATSRASLVKGSQSHGAAVQAGPLWESDQQYEMRLQRQIGDKPWSRSYRKKQFYESCKGQCGISLFVLFSYCFKIDRDLISSSSTYYLSLGNT